MYLVTLQKLAFKFVKECNGVLEINIKISKTQTETDRTYKFTKTHQTNTVKFYDFNTENNAKVLLLERSIEEISNNNYSLNYTDYLTEENTENMYEDGIEIKKLGDVCEFKNGQNITKSKLILVYIQ